MPQNLDDLLKRVRQKHLNEEDVHIFYRIRWKKKGMDDMITSQQVYHKLERLDPLQRKTVSEFIDFLLSQQPVTPSEKKAILLQTSVWSEDSLQQIEEVQKDINTWKPPIF